MRVDFRQLKNKTAAKVLTRYPALLDRWAKKASISTFTDSPWFALTKPISQCRLALITTGGVRQASQQPFDMSDPSGDPSFREIPGDAPLDTLTVTHNYYDDKDAQKDLNIIFPVERVADLVESQEIQSVNHRHFSFMGHIKEPHPDTLVDKSAPAVAAALKEDGVDIVILTPG